MQTICISYEFLSHLIFWKIITLVSFPIYLVIQSFSHSFVYLFIGIMDTKVQNS